MREDEELRLAKEELDKINQDARERRLAELREKAIMDEMAIRDSGYNEGRKEGKGEGIEIGRKEGKKENTKEIVKNMLKENADIEFISRVTGLSIEEIEKLK